MYGPKLWSITIQKSDELGFGTTCTGMLYIPGSNFGPNRDENQCLDCSVWTCECKKLISSTPLTADWEASCVVGKLLSRVLAHGQNPSRRPLHTEAMNGWLGCVESNNSKRSTLIGVMMSNRVGLCMMVSEVTGLSCSLAGINGNGVVSTVQLAVDGEKEPVVQVLYCKYLG